MNVDAFLTRRRPSWEELEGLLGAARRQPEKLGPARVLRLGRRYRGAAADLALARRSFPGDPTVGLPRGARRSRPPRRLRRAHAARLAPAFHRARLLAAGRRAAAGAADRGVAPLRPRRSWRGPGRWSDPGAAAGLVPAAYRSVTEPRPHGSNDELSSSQRAAFSSEIFTNNIEVTFLAFAGGILLGLGTAVAARHNGVLLGTVGGLAIGAGNGRVFFELVVAHGVLELSCIVVAGAAGCGSAGRSSTPACARGRRRSGPRRAGRSRSCSARCRGSWSPG